MDDSDSSVKSTNDTNANVQESASKKTKRKVEKEKETSVKKSVVELEETHHHHKEDKRRKKKDRKEKKGKDAKGPMHFTASSEPVAISQEGEFDGNLPAEVFAEVCLAELQIRRVFSPYIDSVIYLSNPMFEHLLESSLQLIRHWIWFRNRSFRIQNTILI